MTLRELAYFVTGGCTGVFFLSIVIFAYAACAQSSKISREEEAASNECNR